MVSARAAVIALAEGRPLHALCTRRDAGGRMHAPRLDAPKLPIFAVPTTPSTSVVKPGTAVLDDTTGARLALFDPRLRSQAIFLDPAILMTAPDPLLRGAAVNTLVSAVEGLASGSADRMAQALLVQAVRLLAAGLTTQPDGPSLRLDLAQAAIMAGRGTDMTGLGLATVISHAVTRACGAEGGHAKAAALPHVLRFNRDHIAEGRAGLAQALDCAPEVVETAMADLLARLRLPTRLRDLGLPAERLPEVAAACMGDWFLRGNPRPVSTTDEILQILQAAW